MGGRPYEVLIEGDAWANEGDADAPMRWASHHRHKVLPPTRCQYSAVHQLQTAGMETMEAPRSPGTADEAATPLSDIAPF